MSTIMTHNRYYYIMIIYDSNLESNNNNTYVVVLEMVMYFGIISSKSFYVMLVEPAQMAYSMAWLFLLF